MPLVSSVRGAAPEDSDMPRGRFPVEYLHNPNVTKPMEDIYADLDAYTGEFFENEPGLHESIDFVVPLPPLFYGGRFIKGMFFSQAVDYLNYCFPRLRHLFVSLAHSMWCSYPWADSADAYLTCYGNVNRERWFKKINPARAAKPLIPLQDADYTNEYRLAPVRIEKDIDILCVSRLQARKNIMMIAWALKIYRRKYRSQPVRMTLITGSSQDCDPRCLSEHAREQLQELDTILGRTSDYVDLLGYVSHYEKLPEYYSRARVFVLASLIEGKNRSLHEAMACNTPVVCFREHNQFARQGAPMFADTAGLCCTFDPEALADTIHAVLHESECFAPRHAYLRTSGRRNFVSQCLDAIPYYRRALPDFSKGKHLQNAWLDVAVQDNYDVSLYEFIYGKRSGISQVRGVKNIAGVVEQYCKWFGV